MFRLPLCAIKKDTGKICVVENICNFDTIPNLYIVKQKEFFKILDRDGSDRLRVRLEIEKGELINIVVQYESLINNKWIAIVRYDIEHGFFHRDMMTPKGEEIKTPIDISDLNSAIIYAEQDIKDKWEYYKQRYLKGLKK